MKKLLSTLILALACVSGAWAQQDTIKVSTAKELSDALENHADKSNVVIKLMDDIDVSKYDDFKRASVLKATIDGYYYAKDSLGNVDPDPTGHMIKNLKASLIRRIDGGKVKGIQLVQGEQGGWGWNNSAFLALEAEHAEIIDVTLIGCKYEQSEIGDDYYDSDGGLVVNTINDSKVSSVMIIASSMNCDGYNIGGIAGTAYKTTFIECSTDASTILYTEKEPNAYIGGLVGSSEECTFDKCCNSALVSACEKSDNVGGLTGSSTRCKFIDCSNDGVVCQMSSQNKHLLTQTVKPFAKALTYFYTELQAVQFSHAYNMRDYWVIKMRKMYSQKFGKNVKLKDFDIWHQEYYKYLHNATSKEQEAYGELYKIKRHADDFQTLNFYISFVMIALTIYDVCMTIYDANDPDEVGGITSVSYGCTYDHCTNYGMVSCRDAYCGGIVGYADTKSGQGTQIINCMNAGYIQGNEQTGGIVGYMKDGGKVSNCLNVGAIDCVKDTKGAIYGDTNANSSFVTNCFEQVHGVDYKTYAQSGETIKFGYKDIVGGRAAYEMNRIVGFDLFSQTVGEDRLPYLHDDHPVQQNEIRDDADIKYYVDCRAAFTAAMIDPYADIVFEDDIDMEHTYFSAYRNSCKFHGSIDGQNHILKNIKAEVKSVGNFDDDNIRHAMFGYAENATFKNLTLDSLSIKHVVMFAGLVGNSKNCTYENINIINSELYAYNSWVGGLVYESDHDTFSNCRTGEYCHVSTHGIPWIGQYAYAGGMVSKAKNSTFTDCTNAAEVSGRLDVVGGIVALDEGSTFTRCRNFGYVHHDSEYINDNDELGGIVAKAKNSKFYECNNYGKLYCEDANGGGIVGYGENVTIINCLNSTKELKFSKSTCGGIIGYAKKSLVANCVSIADYPAIGDISDMNEASGNNYRVKISNDEGTRWETSLDEETMYSGIVVRWLNNGYENRKEGKVVWHQNVISGSYSDRVPYFDKDDTYALQVTDLPHDVITSADQLVAFAKKVNGGDWFACAVLDADIDLKGIDWKPIGNDVNRFRGVFDGQGHTIHNMKVNINSQGDGAGLFGVAHTGAEIRNVFIADDCEINNSDTGGAAGILGRVNVGWAWANVFIENCGSAAKVSGKRHAGGILGHVTTNTDFSRNVKVMVNKCYNMGNIYASDSNSGLLIGYAQNSGYVTNCWSSGHLEKMNESNPYPYSSNNPSGEAEYFAGYEQKIYIENCKAIYKPGGPKMQQNGVYHFIEANALTSGKLTYYLNSGATEDDLGWYQKIGEDAHPMLVSRGGDIVYSYLDNKIERYTNDMSLSGFKYFGPIRITQNFGMALLDGNSTKDLKLNNEIQVGNATLDRSFKANVPSTVVLPFSGEIDSENGGKFFSFSAMNYDEENNKYTAVMEEVEGGKFEAYTPYLALFAEDADSLVFGRVLIEPVAPAVTQKDEWYFIGATDYKVLGLDDEISQYYYGYAGMEFDGFKLGEFARLGDGASIAPFRCYMRHIASEDAPDSFDVITRKAPTRAAVPSNPLYGVSEEGSMPSAFDVILKGANGETGIATFDNETGEFRFEGWYDLNGNRVEENYQGVRVGGGKKVLIKE